MREFEAGQKRFDASVTRTVDNQLALQEGQRRLEQTVQRFLDAVDQLGGIDVVIRQAIGLIQTFCEANAGLGSAVQQGMDLQQELRKDLQQFATLSEDILDRRLMGMLGQQHQHLREWSEAHQRDIHILLQSYGQSLTLQQSANGLLQQLLERQGHDREQADTQMAQLLHYQQQSAGSMALFTTLLENQHAATQSFDKTVQQSLTVQQEAIEATKALVQQNTTLTDLFNKSIEQQQLITESLDRLHNALTRPTKFQRLRGFVSKTFSRGQ